MVTVYFPAFSWIATFARAEIGTLHFCLSNWMLPVFLSKVHLALIIHKFVKITNLGVFAVNLFSLMI